MRDFLISRIYQAAKKDKNIILISNEQGAPALDNFRSNLKSQFINAGISEQNLIGVAAGLAKKKKKVFVYSIASFITLRSFEQIKIDINLSNLPVTIFGIGASHAYDTAGPTHHSIEDISILRTMKNLEIFSPSDNFILNKIFQYSLTSRYPNYIRLDRYDFGELSKNKIAFQKGYRIIENCISENYVFCTGITTHLVSEASKILKNKYEINIKMIDVFNINFDKKIFKNKKIKNVFCFEEHILEGGLGSVISEILFDLKLNKEINLYRTGIKKKNIYNYDKRLKTLKSNKLTSNNIVKKILSICKKKN